MTSQIRSKDEIFRTRALWVIGIALVIFLVASIGQRILSSQISDAPIWNVLVVSGVLSTTLAALWCRRFGKVLVRIALYVGIVTQFSFIAQHGGITGYQFPTLLAFPPLCALLFGSRETLYFAIAFMAGVFSLAYYHSALPPFELDPDKALSVVTVNVVALALLTLAALIILVRESEKRDDALQHMLAHQRHRATHDELTGLANRNMYNSYFASLLDSPRPIVAYLIDLDGFKTVNDTFGHLAGDTVLVRVARALEKICPEPALIVRLGGDEFLIIEEVSEASSGTSDLGSRIVEQLTQEVEFDGGFAMIGASVGSARFPQDVAALEKLLGSADQALYQAKAQGKMCHVAFHQKAVIAPASIDHSVC